MLGGGPQPQSGQLPAEPETAVPAAEAIPAASEQPGTAAVAAPQVGAGSDVSASLAGEVIQSIQPTDQGAHDAVGEQGQHASHVDLQAMQEVQSPPLPDAVGELAPADVHTPQEAALPTPQAVPSLLSGLNLQPGTDPRILRTWSWLIQSAPVEGPGQSGPDEAADPAPVPPPTEDTSQSAGTTSQAAPAPDTTAAPLPPGFNLGNRVAARTAAVQSEARTIAEQGWGGPAGGLPAPRAARYQQSRVFSRETNDSYGNSLAPLERPPIRRASQPVDSYTSSQRDEGLTRHLSPRPSAQQPIPHDVTAKRPHSTQSWASGPSAPFSLETITLLAIPVDSATEGDDPVQPPPYRYRWHSQPSMSKSPPRTTVKALTAAGTSLASGPLPATGLSLQSDAIDGRHMVSRTALSTPPSTSASIHPAMISGPLPAQAPIITRYAPTSSSTAGIPSGTTPTRNNSSITDAPAHQEHSHVHSIPAQVDMQPRHSRLVIQRGLHGVHAGPTHGADISSLRPYLPNVLASLEEEEAGSVSRMYGTGASAATKDSSTAPGKEGTDVAAVHAYTAPRPSSQPTPGAASSKQHQYEAIRFPSSSGTAGQAAVASVLSTLTGRAQSSSGHVGSLESGLQPSEASQTVQDAPLSTKTSGPIVSMRTGTATFSLTGALSLYRQQKSSPKGVISAPNTARTSAPGTGLTSGPDTGLSGTAEEASYSHRSTTPATLQPRQSASTPARFKSSAVGCATDSTSTFGAFGTGPGTPASATTTTTTIAYSPDRGGVVRDPAEPEVRGQSGQAAGQKPADQRDILTGSTALPETPQAHTAAAVAPTGQLGDQVSAPGWWSTVMCCGKPPKM